MSPEQGKGLQISTPSDIYSLGIILYEMVTGVVPFDADTPLAVIHKHINEPLPSPRSIREDIPSALEDVILKALAKEADERFQTAGEMLTAADQALRAFEKLTLSETLIEAPDLAGGAASPEQTIASKETVAMEYDEDIPVPQETFASKSTVAMEPEDQAEDIAERATVAMEPETEPAASPAVETIPEKVPSESPPRKSTRKTKPLTVILSVVGVLVVALVAVFLLDNFGVINLPIPMPAISDDT
jgi:serine/threonine protein kinase